MARDKAKRTEKKHVDELLGSVKTTTKGHTNLRGRPNTPAANQIVGCCFAPPLTDTLLAKYRELAKKASSPQVRDAFVTMLRCVDKWWSLPQSDEEPVQQFVTIATGNKSKVRPFDMIPLSDDLVDQLWDDVPWMDELNALSNPQGSGPLDALPSGEIRDAAFHLLWYCKEITLDREPLTQEVLK